MDTFRKAYTQRCKEVLSAYGFQRKGKVFVRVVQDIVQTLSYEKLPSGRKRRIRVMFSVMPLCLRIEKWYLDGCYYRELREFEIAQGNDEYSCFLYDSKSEDSMNDCVEEIVRYLKEYLIPFFEKANNSHNALRELIQVDELFHTNRITEGRLAGWKVNEELVKECNLRDNVICHLALKNENYALALRCRQVQEKDSQHAMENRLMYGLLTEEEKSQWEKELAILHEENQRLAAGDVTYFKQILSENEAYSKKVLEEMKIKL